MSKAEKAALKAYPEPTLERITTDVYADARKCYVEGYEQAEQDLALTVEDLELLHTFLYAVKNNKQGCFTFTRLSDEQYQEVLRKFNEQRKK